MSNNLLIK